MSNNKMRDRLIELLKQAEKQQSLNTVCGDIDSLIDSPKGAEFIVDYLIDKDVVSVVRCKDCKYRGELDCPMYHEELQDCDDGDYVYTDIVATDHTVDDGFCHCGERE